MVYYGFTYPQIFNKPPNWDAPWVSQPDRFSFQATSQMIQRLRAAGLKNPWKFVDDFHWETAEPP